MRFELPAPVLAALRERRDLQRRERANRKRSMDDAELEEKHDAFLLDAGLGPMLYITADGRVLTDGRGWSDEEPREATDAEAIAALVIGARKTGITALLDLVPPRPPGGQTCAMCSGERMAELAPGSAGKVICSRCGGRGWTEQ
jgi:hypothetical protein